VLQRKRRPTPPGRILKEHYLKPREITITAFAEAVGVSRKHMSRVINGLARLEADLATKIATVLGTTPQFWLNLQNAVDLYDAQERTKDWKPKALYPAIS